MIDNDGDNGGKGARGARKLSQSRVVTIEHSAHRSEWRIDRFRPHGRRIVLVLEGRWTLAEMFA